MEPSPAPQGMPPDFWKNAPALSASPNQGSKSVSPRTVFKKGGFAHTPPSHGCTRGGGCPVHAQPPPP